MNGSLLLTNVGKHIALEEQERDHFISLLKSRKYRRRQFIVQQGDICRQENFAVTGCLRAFYTGETGVEHVVQFAIEDWWISDLASFITQQPACLNVEALEDCEVLQIQRDDLEALYIAVPKFERYFRIMMQRAYAAQQHRIVSAISKTAEERYMDFLTRYPFFEERIPQVHIASYLGITPEFLSKIRRQLRDVKGKT